MLYKIQIINNWPKLSSTNKYSIHGWMQVFTRDVENIKIPHWYAYVNSYKKNEPVHKFLYEWKNYENKFPLFFV